MTEPTIEVFVCMNVDCRSRGAEAALTRLKQQLGARGMSHVKPEPIICFAACNLGPNIVIPSRRCWLTGVTAERVLEVVDYLQHDADVVSLKEKNDPVLEQMIFEMIDAGLLDKGDSD
jgi:NADH:ubiquinone oxidoreductase subunit E